MSTGLLVFTVVHVLISLVALGSGMAVLLGMLRAMRMPGITAVFLATTVLTSVTGFFFPFKGVTPGIVLGVLSLMVLALAIPAYYVGKLQGPWRGTYVVTAAIALFFNVLVFIVQSFEKIAPLHALAATPDAPVLKAAQLAELVVFIAVATLAYRRFRPV